MKDIQTSEIIRTKNTKKKQQQNTVRKPVTLHKRNTYTTTRTTGHNGGGLRQLSPFSIMAMYTGHPRRRRVRNRLIAHSACVPEYPSHYDTYSCPPCATRVFPL